MPLSVTIPLGQEDNMDGYAVPVLLVKKESFDEDAEMSCGCDGGQEEEAGTKRRPEMAFSPRSVWVVASSSSSSPPPPFAYPPHADHQQHQHQYQPAATLVIPFRPQRVYLGPRLPDDLYCFVFIFAVPLSALEEYALSGHLDAHCQQSQKPKDHFRAVVCSPCLAPATRRQRGFGTGHAPLATFLPPRRHTPGCTMSTARARGSASCQTQQGGGETPSGERGADHRFRVW
ncbi:hypothetical protein R3P38DRAFT_1679197 [Favolaschia claudopus]|uniref:Uncharacterized protein n=1 Tax=Favolaschia claudopus TaxID=2862362 RepID=A0AAW0ADX2_9AGAR